MLIRFKVKNFLSFVDMQEFSMIAGKTYASIERVENDGKLKLLKYAQIFGANASGKSNLIKAMRFFRNTIIKKLPNGYSNLYNKINNDNKSIASYFEIELKIDNKYYAYGFEIVLETGKFVSEWLVELDKKEENTIFSRDILNGKFEFNNKNINEDLLNRLNIYMEDIKFDSSILFLKLINKNKDELFKKYPQIEFVKNVFDWINTKFDVYDPDQPISNYSYFMTKKNIDNVVNAIRSFSTGIINYKIVDTSFDNLSIPKDILEDIKSDIEKEMSNDRSNGGIILRGRNEFYIFRKIDGVFRCQTILFQHNCMNIDFQISEESDGTIRLLDLLEILLDNEDRTYVVDEIDRCLHPQLTQKFISTFLELAKNRNVQLIVTTHESRLLDLSFVRRDEIWFIEKDINGNSKIYSLEEFNTRFDQKIDKAYLNGRYGATPIFDQIFPNIGVENENK